MEIRARYLLIGLFVLAAAAATVGFIYWLSNTGGLGERTTYQVRFDGPVAGLMRGSEVHFNGIKVGEVTELGLLPGSPEAVMATIAIERTTPVRADTRVGLDFRGLTGTATVALTGGSTDAPEVASVDGAPPLLVADPAALKDMTQSARDVLAALDAILAENRESLRNAIADFSVFSNALAGNADRIDGLLAALERFAGGGPETPTVNFDLTIPVVAAVPGVPTGQLAVAEPTTVVAFDTQRIMIEADGGDVAAFPDTRWADSLPLLFQSRFIQSFENAGYPRVAGSLSGIAADFELLLDLRRFRIATTPEPAAEIAFGAKLLDSGGNVIAARLFEIDRPAGSIEEAASAAAALDAVFGEAAAELVVWSLDAMAEAEAAVTLAP
jgi:phospholipid/cholesterol/gamma-HCH transport system substrate-binding protein